jgi:hypothetical protein
LIVTHAAHRLQAASDGAIAVFDDRQIDIKYANRHSVQYIPDAAPSALLVGDQGEITVDRPFALFL